MIDALHQGARVGTFSTTYVGGYARPHLPDTGER